MQNTERKTNQRMPGRSAAVIGNELGKGPVTATPSVKPASISPSPQKPPATDVSKKRTG